MRIPSIAGAWRRTFFSWRVSREACPGRNSDAPADAIWQCLTPFYIRLIKGRRNSRIYHSLWEYSNVRYVWFYVPTRGTRQESERSPSPLRNGGFHVEAPGMLAPIHPPLLIQCDIKILDDGKCLITMQLPIRHIQPTGV